MYCINSLNRDMISRLLNDKDKQIKNFADGLTLITNLKREIQIADIDEEVSEAIETLIRFWNEYDKGVDIDKREPIKIYIDSSGGSLHATYTIIDAISMSKTPVWTINIGTAFSGGFFAFIAGHKRIAYPHSSFLYHEGSTSGGMQQDAGKFRNYASYYDKLLAGLKTVTLKYTKITEELYDKHMKDDWWIMADEALELGICDEIATEFVEGGVNCNEDCKS